MAKKRYIELSRLAELTTLVDDGGEAYISVSDLKGIIARSEIIEIEQKEREE